MGGWLGGWVGGEGLGGEGAALIGRPFVPRLPERGNRIKIGSTGSFRCLLCVSVCVCVCYVSFIVVFAVRNGRFAC